VIPALYNGVSQQPPILRTIDQTEREENTWAVLADGVGKRPPTEHIAALGTFSGDAFIHHINRDATERYIVVIDGGQIKVFDHTTGAQQVINTPGGLGYLTNGTFRAVTVADYTFIVNTAKVCGMAAAGADTTADPAFYRWPNRGTAGADINVGLLVASVITGQPYQYRINPPGGTFRGEIASMEKLPETAINGDIYKITGSAETGFVSYYVRRNGAVWDETVGLGLVNQLDATTLPHALVREADGTFTFAPFSWSPRRVGDDDSNPRPTFIGRTIRDVFFYQNRLAFLVDENVVFSCAGDFGNFWRNTVLDVIDSDVIDFAITTANVALLNWAVPFNDGIVLFADQTQFSLTNGQDGLTPSSAAIRPVMHYEVNVGVQPVRLGSEVYFCGDQNAHSVVWEYTRLDDTDATDAAEITAHCPRYLPAGLKHLVAATNLKALFAITGTDEVFVYQYYWNGNEKVMSAWRKWIFDAPVVSAEFLGGYLYLLVRRGSDLFLERADLEPSSVPAEQDMQVYLDRRCAVTGVYDPVLDRTVFTLPYVYDPARLRLVRGKTHPTRPGSLVDPSQYVPLTPTTLAVPGRDGSRPYTAGSSYTMYLQFSRQFPQDWQGNPLTTGRLQLRTWTVSYSGTGFFRTEVSPYGAAGVPEVEEIVPAKLADFTGKVIGSADLRLNQPAFHTGSYSFQIYGDAAQATVALSNDSHVGSTFVSAEWEGFFYQRSQ
jgi:hypothetical protein